MKSERAKELICMHENAENAEAYYGYEMLVARSAVELAEDDARERAIKAFKRYITKNSISSILPSDKILMDIAMSEFKEKYDNGGKRLSNIWLNRT